MKCTLNPKFESISGRSGNVLFKNCTLRGYIIARLYADMKNGTLS